MRSGRAIGVSALFAALTAVMTWPQPAVLATHAAPHHDVYFNLWRLRWIHHALTASPWDLFNGNQFFPEQQVLAFSDAMLAEGAAALPLLAVGLPPVLVHNLLLLGAIAASGIGMFVLARHLSGSTPGGIVAGIVFAFAPYRFEHYMHLELQWAVWAPWAFWALQRTIETRALKFGVLTGAFLALQMLSSIYYAIFLAPLLAVVGGLQIMTMPLREQLFVLRSVAAGVLLAALVAWPYAAPYGEASKRVGARSEAEVRTFSAKPNNYLSATDTNLLYGSRRRAPSERRLFPGVVPLLLALIGLLLVPVRAPSIAYLIALVAAFLLSLGMNGPFYPLLYEHVSVFQGLRAPARAAIFCLLFLGVLAAHGFAALASYAAPIVRRLLAVGLTGALLLEYWVAPLPLAPFQNDAPPLYAWLARQPRGVVAELPMQFPFDPRYTYMSTFHWMPIVNGYSGYYPPSYIERREAMEEFPALGALARLKADGVQYLIVHAGGYSSEEYGRIVQGLRGEFGLPYLGEFDDGWGEATVFGMR